MNWWSAAATFAGIAALGFILEYAVNKRYRLIHLSVAYGMLVGVL